MASAVGLLPVSCEETSASKSRRRSALLPVFSLPLSDIDGE